MTLHELRRRPLENDQLLGAEVTDRDDESAAWGQLLGERRRHGRCGRSDDDAVERRRFGPPAGSVAQPRADVREPEAAEALLGLDQQVRKPLDRVDVRAQVGKHRRLITGSGADLEDALAAARRERLSHQRDDVRLGDGLAASDGERRVVIRFVGEVRRQKPFARDPRQACEHAPALDAARGDLARDHAPAIAARLRRRDAQAPHSTVALP